MSEEGGSLGSARAAQMAVLALVGVSVLLTDEPTARERLRAAKDEISTWPTDAQSIRRALQDQCRGGILDLDDSLKLSWFDEHRMPPVVDAEGKGLPHEAGSVAGAAGVAGGDGENESVRIAVYCYQLSSPCAGLATLDGLPAGDSVSFDEKAWCTDKDPPVVEAKPDTWWPRYFVNERPIESYVETWRIQNERLNATLKTLAVASHGAHDALKKYQRDLSANGTSESPAPTGDHDPCKQPKQNAKEAATHASDALKSLRAASADLRNATPRPHGPSIVLESRIAHLLLAVTSPDPHTAADARVAEAGAAGAGGAEAGASSPIASCIRPTPIEFGPGPKGSRNSVDVSPRGRKWGIGKLTEAGVWADIRDLDLASAESHLIDAANKAELDGEIFGVKLNGADALRWLWLPIATAELYALALLRWGKRAEDELLSGWPKVPWQCFVFLCTAAGVTLSLRGEKPIDHFYRTSVIVGGLLGVAALLLLVLNPRQKEEDSRPTWLE